MRTFNLKRSRAVKVETEMIAGQRVIRARLPVGRRKLWLSVSYARHWVFCWGWRRHGFASGSMGFGIGAITYVWGHA